MEPLIKRIPKIGASVKTTHNQFISYNYVINCNYIYPYGIKTTRNGEYFIINIPHPTYQKIAKKEILNLSINSTSVMIDINLLKYIINKLY